MANEAVTIKIWKLSHWKLKQITAISRESIVEFIDRMLDEEAERMRVKFIYKGKPKGDL